MTSDRSKSQIANKPLSRRHYIKYAGAGVAAIAIAAGSYYSAKHSGILNRQPLADFDYEPSYINPTSEDTIQFTNKSFDPDDGDTIDNTLKKILGLDGPEHLTYTWYVDDSPAAHTRDFSTRLLAASISTQHKVKLSVSDGRKEDSTQEVVEVDPDQLYPLNDFKLPIKGITYDAGIAWDRLPKGQTTWRNWMTNDKLHREFDLIQNHPGTEKLRSHVKDSRM